MLQDVTEISVHTRPMLHQQLHSLCLSRDEVDVYCAAVLGLLAGCSGNTDAGFYSLHASVQGCRTEGCETRVGFKSGLCAVEEAALCAEAHVPANRWLPGSFLPMLLLFLAAHMFAEACWLVFESAWRITAHALGRIHSSCIASEQQQQAKRDCRGCSNKPHIHHHAAELSG